MTAVTFLLMALALILSRPRMHSRPLMGEPWLSRERTSFVNGFFICMVIFSHLGKFGCYYPDERRLIVLLIPGQLIVTTFFFYSGYGIMYSILKKREAYVKSLLTRRFPQLLLNFGIAVLIYVIAQHFLGQDYSCSHILMSLIGWEKAGNSNWFICMTLLAYLLIFLSFTVCGARRPYWAIALTAAVMLTSLYIIGQFKESYWVSTYLCIPAGMLFAVRKEHVEKYLSKVPYSAIGLGILMIVCGCVLYSLLYSPPHILHGLLQLPYNLRLFLANIGSIMFAGGLTYVYSCISFRKLSPVMVWLGGAALFPVYIFHLMPMIIGHHFKWDTCHPQFYIAGCLIASLLLAVLFQRIYSILGKLLFPGFPLSAPGKPAR